MRGDLRQYSVSNSIMKNLQFLVPSSEPSISVLNGTGVVTTPLTECSPGKITLKCFNLGLLASAVYIIATWLPMRVCFLDVLEMSLEKY